MSARPLEFTVKVNEAAAVADLVVQLADARRVGDDLRGQLARRVASLELVSVRLHAASLEADPDRPSTFYLAADGLGGRGEQGLLFQIAPASHAAAEGFSGFVSVGRVRPGGAREFVVNAIPFGSHDHTNIRAFAGRAGRAFLPRPQGPLAAIAVGNRHPEISLPAAFEAFGSLLETTGRNLASTVQLSATREMTTEKALAARDGENPTAAGHTRVSIAHLYDAGLWAAVRAGWREGYNAEADHFIVTGDTSDEIARSLDLVKEAVVEATGYTKFTTDTSRLFELRADARHPAAWSDATVEERFDALFSASERAWILSEFSAPLRIGDRNYEFTRGDVVRLSVKFGRSLQLNEELFDFISRTKASSGQGSSFDFEPSIDEAETLTTAKELIFYMHWLKERGRPAQLVPPNLGFKKRQAYPSALETSDEHGVGLADYVHHKMWPELLPRVVSEFSGRPLEELAARIAELAAVARHFDGTLSIHSGSGKQAEVLEHIGKATTGRVNYKISGELQLQLLDVLSEQPAGSPWRSVYDRMVARCNRFAAAGAFGEESSLATKYIEMGRGSYLGDHRRGRVDGNLFLVFWLGNVVGSRDIESPDGDRRFFKEKLDELSRPLVEEVRRRNAEYIVWLGQKLVG